MFPPPTCEGEHGRWKDWSGQLKAYVALYKPVAQELMERIEGSNVPIDDLSTQAEENSSYVGQELVKSAKQLHYLLANVN